MAFLNLRKKGKELPSDIDLDMPPEPPEMLKEEISTEGPIDEELMPLKRGKPAKKEGLPELPPLPKIEGGPESKDFFTAPFKESAELSPLEEEDLELPPPPAALEIKKEKKGLFSFIKLKKPAEKLPLPEIGEEIPEMPPLPEEGEEFPEIPPLPKEEMPPLPEAGKEFPEIPPLSEERAPVAPPLEISAPLPAEPLKPEVEEPIPEIKKVPIKDKKFVTINDFKQIQSDISGAKGVLKGIDGFFVKLEEVKSVGDKGYKELYNNLQDIQKKIMFVDKTLFKEIG